MTIKIKFNECFLAHQINKNRSVTLTEISSKTGISKSQLTKLNKGETLNPTINIIEKLCIHFNCGIYDILEFDPPLEK